MIYVILLLLALFSASPAKAGDRIELGERLFNGSEEIEGSVSIGATRLNQPMTKFACRTCHQRDGSGGSEAGAPAITWDVLTLPAAFRPAYDIDAFRAALMEGRRAGGGVLDTAMPRYTIPEETLEGLAGYLAALPVFQRRGIDPRAVTFGVAIPSDNSGPARVHLALLRDALARHGRIFGREMRIVGLEGSRDAIIRQADEGVAAMVGLVPSQEISVGDFERKGVPVLFPLALLQGNEDPTVVKGLMASRDKQLEALLEKARNDGRRKIGLACLKARCARPDDADTILTDASAKTSLSELDALLLTGQDEAQALAMIARVPPDLPVYAIAGELPSLPAAALARKVPLTLANGYGGLEADGGGLLERHARRAAMLIAEALASTGRPLTRHRLIAGFDRKSLPEFGLDYARYPLTGTDGVSFLHVPSGR